MIDTVVNAGIWLNIECNIGIVSACLPVLRPLFSKTFGTTIRSKFYPSRGSRYGTGSQRLPDGEKGVPSNTAGAGTNVSAGSGGAANHIRNYKAWYDVSTTTKTGDTGSDCSQEEMVPMGRIAVRHDVDLEASNAKNNVARAV